MCGAGAGRGGCGVPPAVDSDIFAMNIGFPLRCQHFVVAESIAADGSRKYEEMQRVIGHTVVQTR